MTEDQLEKKLRSHQLRPTQQRMQLGGLLFLESDRHITAEELYTEAKSQNFSISLATVYNTLNQFSAVGLLKEVHIDRSRCYYDTNTTEHHHIFKASTGEIWDIPVDTINTQIDLEQIKHIGHVESVDIIIRIS